MPIYPYKCKKCGHEFEVLFLSTEEYGKFTPDPCHKCEGDVERTIGIPVISRSGDEIPPSSMDLDSLRNKGIKE